jgi:nicotinamide riboside kinase
MGIRPKHWEAAKMFAKDHRDQESALCLEDIAQDMARGKVAAADAV